METDMSNPRIPAHACLRATSGTSRITRRGALGAVAAALAGGFTGGFASTAHAADAWPSKAVRIIVPFAPGGGADSSARVLGEVMGPPLGQSFIVENRPGAGSAIGVQAAAAARDQHTLLMGSNSMVIGPILNPAITYDVFRDFDPVGMVSSQPLVLVVPGNSPLRSLADVVAAAKAQPGQLSAGNSGNGTLAHLTAELFSLQTGTSLVNVPYKGESALMPDLIGGRVSLGFLNLPSVLVHVRSGALRALAVSSAQPAPELPGVATLASLGYPALQVLGWAALLAPKGLPPEAQARLERQLQAALGNDAVKQRFAGIGVAPFTGMGRDATLKYLREEDARWREVIKTRGIKLEG
jgi:tripartite-type tricarboxylate transporter receptor subunit TctC